MAIKTITDFRAKLVGGGARPNLFEANITFPGSGVDGANWSGTGNAQEEFRFFCKATSMPTQTIGSVDVPFRGRILKVAGDRTFEPWSVTVINDENFAVRKSFEAWTEKINAIASGEGTVNPNEYMGSGTIKQLSRTNTVAGADSNHLVKHTYQMQEIWPSEIGSIDLSYDSSDAIEEFTVTFQVQFFESQAPGAAGRQQEAGDTAAGNTAQTLTQS